MREREGPTGKKGKGGQGEEEMKGASRCCSRVLLVDRGSRRWRAGCGIGGLLGAPRRCSYVPTKNTSANFAKSPLGKGDFWGFQAANIWQYLLIETFSRILRN
jgi:hypothetical protein